MLEAAQACLAGWPFKGDAAAQALCHLKLGMLTEEQFHLEEREKLDWADAALSAGDALGDQGQQRKTNQFNAHTHTTYMTLILIFIFIVDIHLCRRVYPTPPHPPHINDVITVHQVLISTKTMISRCAILDNITT